MSDKESKIKDEYMDQDDDYDDDNEEEDVSFCPAALGLHRIGTALPKKKKNAPLQKLNARGMPARMRKKNQKYDDEDEDAPKSPVKGSPKKKAFTTPKSASKTTPATTLRKRPPPVEKTIKDKNSDRESEEEEDEEVDSDSDKSLPPPKSARKSTKKGNDRNAVTTEAMNMNQIDKKACQRLGLRLRNLLKLPKAHKFVMYEFFYSNIDHAIFLGASDFEVCLVEKYPQLKTRMMTRIEWNKIRNNFGKPRRCSPKFFEEERMQLERKRQKIRLLQSRKSGDHSFVCDLPPEIPVPLSIGSKVTARLREPQDGLFTGFVDGLVHKTHSYRIVFERMGIGSQEVPDYEVMATETIESIKISAITKDFASRQDISYYMVSPLRPAGPLSSVSSYSINKRDPMLAGDSCPKIEQYRPKAPSLVLPTSGSVGGYPVKLLEAIVLVRKTMEAKQLQLLKIRRMNVEAEVVKSFGDVAPEEFQKQYANLMMGMERMNTNLMDYLNLLQAQSDEFIDTPEELSFLTPTFLREKCRDLAMQTFAKNNQNAIHDDAMTKLIGNLATIMWVTSNLKNDQYPNVVSVLDGCMEETQAQLDPDNKTLFQKSVQAHIRQIQIGIFDERNEDMYENADELIEDVEEVLDGESILGV
ncbi:unnamed protein product [Diamesa serratosioi]